MCSASFSPSPIIVRCGGGIGEVVVGRGQHSRRNSGVPGTLTRVSSGSVESTFLLSLSHTSLTTFTKIIKQHSSMSRGVKSERAILKQRQKEGAI